MTTPNLLKLSIEARIRDMRAYIQQALTPQMVDGALDDAIARAMIDVPDHINNEVNAAVRDVCRSHVNAAFLGVRFDEKATNAIRAVVLRQLGESMLREADAADAKAGQP